MLNQPLLELLSLYPHFCPRKLSNERKREPAFTITSEKYTGFPFARLSVGTGTGSNSESFFSQRKVVVQMQPISALPAANGFSSASDGPEICSLNCRSTSIPVPFEMMLAKS